MTRPGTQARRGDDLFGSILEPRPSAFALLHRPEANGAGVLDVLTGDVSEVAELKDIPRPAGGPPPAGGGPPAGGETRHDVLAIIPYRQIRERGFDCADDGTPLITLRVSRQGTVPVKEALARIPNLPVDVSDCHFDVTDAEYADIIRTVITDAIGQGEGANFVIKRSFITSITDYTPCRALAFFRRLLEIESGAYWTFIVHTGDRTLVGATPERHITLRDGQVTMNPISGTLRYQMAVPSLPEVMSFLYDQKETDELYMVLDEELKMMTRICEPGVRVTGPRLKEMARLAHTEYFIEGSSRWDIRDILRESMFAPTVTGSPLENACRVIRRYEPSSRGYYSGVAALIGHDASGAATLDSSILIRTADIDSGGRLRLGVGATIVRHSDPAGEAAESRAKAAGLMAALGAGRSTRFGAHPDVRGALQRRNATIAAFWLGQETTRKRPFPALAGCRTLIVDAEDTFTSMVEHQLRAMGMPVTLCNYNEIPSFASFDFVVLGPGPGDPSDARHPKIASLRTAVGSLLAERRPFLAVCLSHQVLSLRLGFGIRPLPAPNQGTQQEIDLFGDRQQVGFYNTFAAWADADTTTVDGVGVVGISRDRDSGEVYGLRGPHFASLQFHAESVLTQNGAHILGTSITHALSNASRSWEGGAAKIAARI